MLKGETIYLRMLEPEDYDLTHQWHTDYNIQKMTCGQFRFVSKAIEKNWAQSKATNNARDIYLAICANEDDKMIGYISINDIDFVHRSCHCGGVVVGDKQHRNMREYVEAVTLVHDYAFNHLNMNRISGGCLVEHMMSRAEMEGFYYDLEGTEREAIFKNGSYHDKRNYALMSKTYFEHQAKGDYAIDNTIRRIALNVKKMKYNK